MVQRIHLIALSLLFTLIGLHQRCSAGVLTDPTGDAASNSTGGAGIDITSLEVTVGSSTVDVILTFSSLTPIQPASAGAENSLFGFIDFDLDLNPLTGSNPGPVEFFGSGLANPPSGLGVDATVLLGSEFSSPGSVEITFASGATGVGAVSTTATRMSITFARSLFATTDFSFAAVVGDFATATDVTGIGQASPAAVPEPNSLALMSLVSVALLRFRHQRVARGTGLSL